MQRRERAKRADFRSRYSSLFPSPVTFLSFRLQPRASLSNFTFFRFRSTKETNSRRELRREKKNLACFTFASYQFVCRRRVEIVCGK